MNAHDSSTAAIDAPVDVAIDPLTFEPISGPVLQCLADVEPRPIEWLWPGRIPLGRITLIVGVPGVGKSFLTTDLSARVSTATPFPDQKPCPCGSVIFITAEDDPADTIRPRLDAHQADVSRIHLLSMVRSPDASGQTVETLFTLSDVSSLEQALVQVKDCKLVIIDPIGSFLGLETDSNRDNEVRGILAPIAKLAERFGAAVVIVAHRRKGAVGGADESALGSRAFTGLARAVWHLSRDAGDCDRRLFLPGKNNLAAEGTGLAFTLAGEPTRLHWEDQPVEMNADEGLAEEMKAAQGRGGRIADERSRAQAWLSELLADHCEHEVESIRNQAQAAGLSWRTMQRAASQLGVKRERVSCTGGGAVWQLPVGQ